MIGSMAACNGFFLSTCSALLERMINTVPSSIVLSDIIEVVPVKPRGLNIAINSNNSMTVSGTVRVSNYSLGFVPHNDEESLP